MQEMVIHSQAKNLVREAVIGRFEPHLLLVQVFLPVLIKNHWTLYVYDLENRRIQLLDSRPGRKKTMLSGVQQNLPRLSVVGCPQKDVSPYDLRTFNFITRCTLKLMIEDHGEYVVLSTKCTPRPCPERLKGISNLYFCSIEFDRSMVYLRHWSTGLPLLQPVAHTLLDERECILAPSSGHRPVDQFRSTGSWRLEPPTG
ncbi:hypothetical protein AAG906_019932 [Vitis piasezkii]